jgi:hypothetical protein
MLAISSFLAAEDTDLHLYAINANIVTVWVRWLLWW